MATPTFFQALKKSFTDVPIDTSKDNAILTTDFLEATESLCGLFGRSNIYQSPIGHILTNVSDVMGSVAFTPVKNDMLGNVKVHLSLSPSFLSILTSLPVQKLRDRQLASPTESSILQSLVINELKTKKHTAAEGLLWLTRYVSLLFPSTLNGAPFVYFILVTELLLTQE